GSHRPPRSLALRCAILLALVGACASSPQVDFAATPPLGTVHPEDTGRDGAGAPWARQGRATPGPWTRQAPATHDWDTALDAQVMLMSPEVRAAYVRMVAGLRGYSDVQRQELVAEQQADAGRFVEVWVAMQTSRWEWNDLTSNRTLWNVTFLDED